MGAVADNTIAQNVVTARPYSSSWVDRLTNWVEHLPGPAWLYYLAVAFVLVLARTIIAWLDGSYPVGTFFPFHIVDQSNSMYFLFVLHYLDDGASTALAASRSVLTVDDAGYDRLRYELTTMPARPVLIWSFIGLLFGLAYLPFLVPDAQLQSLKLFTSPTSVVVDVVLSGLNWMINAVFIYHTIRQLRLVSRIYTQHANVNIFEIGPLYALSRITAITTVALLFITYLYVTFWISWQFTSAADAAIVLAFVLIALATFVWPLLGAHRLLQEEKDHRKLEVARRVEAVTDKLHRRVDADDLREMEGLKDALDGLVAERGILDKVSTWPWHPDAVRAVVTALLLPIAIWIVTRVLERLGF
jgi:hypothetical protein